MDEAVWDCRPEPVFLAKSLSQTHTHSMTFTVVLSPFEEEAVAYLLEKNRSKWLMLVKLLVAGGTR